MKNIYSLFMPLILLALTACFSAKEAKPQASQRMEFSKSGVTIDASYDARLDNLIPGYKIVTVAVTNQSFDVLKLNPVKDKWEIIDAGGKPRKAINSIRVHNPRVFGQLPSKVQMLVDYPVGINMGYSETLDLFFPVNTDLRNFRGISFYSAEWDQTFDAMANLDSPTAVPIEQIDSVPSQAAPAKKTSQRD